MKSVMSEIKMIIIELVNWIVQKIYVEIDIFWSDLNNVMMEIQTIMIVVILVVKILCI